MRRRFVVTLAVTASILGLVPLTAQAKDYATYQQTSGNSSTQGWAMDAQVVQFTGNNWWDISSSNVTIWTLASEGSYPYAETGFRWGWDSVGTYEGNSCWYVGVSNSNDNGWVQYPLTWYQSADSLTTGQSYEFMMLQGSGATQFWVSNDSGTRVWYNSSMSPNVPMNISNYGLEADNDYTNFTNNNITINWVGWSPSGSNWLQCPSYQGYPCTGHGSDCGGVPFSIESFSTCGGTWIWHN